jgi:hypothetical protein
MPSIACQNPSLTFMAFNGRADYAVKRIQKREIFRFIMRKLRMVWSVVAKMHL